MKKFGLFVALLGVFSYIAFPTTLQALELSISGASKRASTCGNKKAGSIFFQIQGGTPTYRVLLSDSNNNIVGDLLFTEASGSFPGLINGTYTLRVVDSNRVSANSFPILVNNTCIPLLLYCCR